MEVKTELPFKLSRKFIFSPANKFDILWNFSFLAADILETFDLRQNIQKLDTQQDGLLNLLNS